MKLKNKRTGEIIDIHKGEITLHYNQGRKTIHFKRLEDLEEWEDVEEPKEYWYIGNGGDVFGFSDYYQGTEIEKAHREIGNLFESKEEAEKAVEKLKAWKRLKDKGVKLEAVVDNFFCLDVYMSGEPYEAIKDDLKIVFGGEE